MDAFYHYVCLAVIIEDLWLINTCSIHFYPTFV